MANSLSKYLQDKFLAWIKGTAFPASPANVYVALYTANPTSANASGTEVTGGTYARVAVASTAWSAASGSDPEQISNSGTIDFGTTLPACTLTGWAIYDASSAGNELFFGSFASSIVVNAGDPTSFAIGALVIQVGNP